MLKTNIQTNKQTNPGKIANIHKRILYHQCRSKGTSVQDSYPKISGGGGGGRGWRGGRERERVAVTDGIELGYGLGIFLFNC